MKTRKKLMVKKTSLKTLVLSVPSPRRRRMLLMRDSRRLMRLKLTKKKSMPQFLPHQVKIRILHKTSNMLQGANKVYKSLPSMMCSRQVVIKSIVVSMLTIS